MTIAPDLKLWLSTSDINRLQLFSITKCSSGTRWERLLHWYDYSYLGFSRRKKVLYEFKECRFRLHNDIREKRFIQFLLDISFCCNVVAFTSSRWNFVFIFLIFSSQPRYPLTRKSCRKSTFWTFLSKGSPWNGHHAWWLLVNRWDSKSATSLWHTACRQ